jgi:hypothetical protein
MPRRTMALFLLSVSCVMSSTEARYCAADVITDAHVAEMRRQLTHMIPPPRPKKPPAPKMKSKDSHTNDNSNDNNKLGRGLRADRESDVAYDARLWDMEWVCVDQETIIVYDPRLLTDSPVDMPKGFTHAKTALAALPRLDSSGDIYYLRQASQRLAQEKLVALGHADAAVVGNPSSLVLGTALTRENSHAEIPVRLASSEEVRQLSTPFSKCTVPIVFETLWNHNLNEWFARAPVAFSAHRDLLPPELSITLFSKAKLPIPHFNKLALSPFSHHEVTSFADFSSRLPEQTPSNATAEGTHKRCFRRLLVWRETRENRAATPSFGPKLLSYHAAALARLTASEPPLWRTSASGHLRVLIEKRAKYGQTRQFLELDSLLRDCNARAGLGTLTHPRHGGESPGAADAGTNDAGGSGSAPDAWRTKWRSVECIAHEFGAHGEGFLHDMWVMSQVDVFVTFHGAGQMNAIFLPEHASMIEVRGLNASMNLADHWHPQISRSSGFQYLWWGLIINDPALVGQSGLDSQGFYGDADKGNWKAFMFRKRDQNVKLVWPHLGYLLQKVLKVDRNVTTFKSLFGRGFNYYGTEKGAGVVYEAIPGHHLPRRHAVVHPPGGR